MTPLTEDDARAVSKLQTDLFARIDEFHAGDGGVDGDEGVLTIVLPGWRAARGRTGVGAADPDNLVKLYTTIYSFGPGSKHKEWAATTVARVIEFAGSDIEEWARLERAKSS